MNGDGVELTRRPFSLGLFFTRRASLRPSPKRGWFATKFLGCSLKLLINGENKEFGDGISLEEVILQLGVRKETVVAEVNRRIVQNHERAQWRMAEGDQVELIQFVGGG